jgi:AcrR family transcriptional regulator
MSVTKIASRDDVRAGILEASLALMNEGGLGSLSMREVARRAGVSHQAPYHYFADREAILAELAGEGFDKLYDYMVSAIGLARDKTGRNRALGEAYIRFALNNPEVFRLMFRCEMVDLLKYPEAKQKADRCFHYVAEVLGAGASAVSVTDKTSAELVPVIAAWSIAHGLATLMLEGKLGAAFGDTPDQREEAAKRILAFTAQQFSK